MDHALLLIVVAGFLLGLVILVSSALEKRRWGVANGRASVACNMIPSAMYRAHVSLDGPVCGYSSLTFVDVARL
jgi:hypothetical protein